MTSSQANKSLLTRLLELWQGWSFGTKTLGAMFVGAALGFWIGPPIAAVQPIGEMFIRALIMSAIPLVFFNLLAGLTSAGDIKLLGRVGLRIILCYLFSTVVALSLGLTIIHWLKPGLGIPLRAEVSQEIGSVPSIANTLMDLVPRNVFQALTSGNVAQIAVFAALLGVATVMLPTDKREPLARAYTLVADALRQLTTLIMGIAPLGVAALAAVTAGEYGTTILGSLSLFIGGVWLAQLLVAIFYLVVLRLVTGTRPLDFLQRTSSLYATTIATCSSLASLAVTMDVADKRLGIPRRIYAITLPLGSQFNKDGTSVTLAAILLFTAQAAGVHFDLGTIISILFVGLILSEGIGGVPGGGLVIAMIFVKAFNLPVEVAAIVGGVYRFFDMSNTTINCMGDLVWTKVVARFESSQATAPAIKAQPDQPTA
ncbi:MAG: dicarboxylate/amino acid:cation symporter [Opitutaceae bacterium]|nr:dicarboxylate/amino acid:cation symporter [Opitutaceae bacterium]